MNALEEVVDYLKPKILSANINNPKANIGCVLLKLFSVKDEVEFDEELSSFCWASFYTMTSLFLKETPESEKATASLTNVSMKIGQRISKRIQRDPLPYHQEVKVGDLFVEAFFNLGFVDIEYKKIRTEGYNISTGSRWNEFRAVIKSKIDKRGLYATVPYKPDSISSFYQDVRGEQRQIIKGNKDLYKNFEVDKPWIKAIDKLQQQPWRINTQVLDIILDEEEFFTTHEDKKKQDSKEIEWEFIVTKAKAAAEYDRFYQYIEADYRGRLYYTESFMNFQGSDTARGIMLFDNGEPMTERGLDWLAIHTATSFNQSYSKDAIPEWCTSDYYSHLEQEELESISVDKMTLVDRYEWTMQNMRMIQDIADDPKEFQRWKDAEKPVAFIAACVEWMNYSECPDGYVSYLPIPIDGSNNGWQHLGAISKDTETGKLVGLIASEIQSDFYVQTAKELIRINKDEKLSKVLTDMPMKSIRKGISKRGSMTRAYSAGAVKIALNMYHDCKTEDYHKKYGVTEQDCAKLARLLIKAIKTVCPGPLDTMKFLQDIAAYEIGRYKKKPITEEAEKIEYGELKIRRKELNEIRIKTVEELDELNDISLLMREYDSELISGLGNRELVWETPTGFPVVYECYEMNRHRTRGSINGWGDVSGATTDQINHVITMPSKLPDVKGFMSGISPNFIHSQDASHMSLTILGWHGSFGAVHDSFSSHASNIDDLLSVTKETFIGMYDSDNYYNKIETMLVTDDNKYDVEQPDRGTLIIKEIEDSDYFFA